MQLPPNIREVRDNDEAAAEPDDKARL